MVVFAYVYIDPLLDGTLVDTLPEEFQEWADSIDSVYRDLGDRTAFSQLIHDIDSLLQSDLSSSVNLVIRSVGDLGTVVNEVGDRLRQLEQRQIDLTILANLEQTSGLNESSASNPLSLSDQLNTFHTLQTEQRQRRLKRGHARSRLKLKPPPGRAPYGYRRGKDRYILDRSTAPVVKDFFENFLLYGSLRRSVRYLARKYNKKISVSTGKRWLTNPVYRGHLAYKTGDVINNTHAAVLTEDEAAQVDRLLRRNSQLPRRSASAERSLAGLVHCAQCQSSMTISRVTQRRPKKGQKPEYLYLRPTNCSYGGADAVSLNNPPSGTDNAKKPKACPGLPYNRVLDQTIDQICATLPKMVATVPLPDLTQAKQRLEDQIKEKQQIIAQLPTLGANGVLDQNTIELRTYTLRTEIAQLQSSLAQLPPVNLKETVQTVSLRQFWLDLSESERRFYFREFIHHIEIVRSPTDLSQWDIKLVLLLDRGGR